MTSFKPPITHEDSTPPPDMRRSISETRDLSATKDVASVVDEFTRLMASSAGDTPFAQDAIDRLGKSIALQLAQIMSAKEQRQPAKQSKPRRHRKRTMNREEFRTPFMPRGETSPSDISTPATRYGTIAPSPGYGSLWGLPDRDNTPYRPDNANAGNANLPAARPSTAWMTAFTEDEDELLLHMRRDQCCSWEDIQKAFPGKERTLIIDRWRKHLKYAAYRPDTTEAEVRSGPGVRYSRQEDDLLVELKEVRKLPWKEITTHFPERSIYSLSYHYSAIKNKHSKLARDELTAKVRETPRDDDDEAAGTVRRKTGAELFAELQSNIEHEQFRKGRSASVMTSRRRDELSATPEGEDDDAGPEMVHCDPESDYTTEPAIDPRLDDSNGAEPLNPDEGPCSMPPPTHLVPRSRFPPQSRVHPLLQSMMRANPTTTAVINSSTTFGINRPPLQPLSDPQSRSPAAFVKPALVPSSQTETASVENFPPQSHTSGIAANPNSDVANSSQEIDTHRKVMALVEKFTTPEIVSITDTLATQSLPSINNAIPETETSQPMRCPTQPRPRKSRKITARLHDRSRVVATASVVKQEPVDHVNICILDPPTSVTQVSSRCATDEPAQALDVIESEARETPSDVVDHTLSSTALPERSSPDPLVNESSKLKSTDCPRRSGSVSSMSSNDSSVLGHGMRGASAASSTHGEIAPPAASTPLTVPSSSCSSKTGSSQLLKNRTGHNSASPTAGTQRSTRMDGSRLLRSHSEMPARRSVRRRERGLAEAAMTVKVKAEVGSDDELAV